MSIAPASDLATLSEPAKLQLAKTTDVLVEVLHERARLHREPQTDLPRLFELLYDGDRKSLLRVVALIVARIEALPLVSE